MTASTSTTEGPSWNAAAQGWAAHWAAFGAPAREAVAHAAGIGPGTSLLDLGCGSGEFCALAAARGSSVSGIDVADGLVEIARQKLPEADLRVGAVERLPWPDDRFDVVTAFNVLQFAADFLAALTEARRVTRPGGRVAVCNWGRLGDQQVQTIFEPLAELKPQGPRDAQNVGEPGVLEGLARKAGLTPERVEEIEVPYSFPDWAGLERALLGLAPAYRIDDATAARVIRETVDGRAERFRRPDGSYWFDNRWRFMIAAA
jgi:SAM-dependent methyltransferase